MTRRAERKEKKKSLLPSIASVKASCVQFLPVPDVRWAKKRVKCVAGESNMLVCLWLECEVTFLLLSLLLLPSSCVWRTKRATKAETQVRESTSSLFRYTTAATRQERMSSLSRMNEEIRHPVGQEDSSFSCYRNDGRSSNKSETRKAIRVSIVILLLLLLHFLLPFCQQHIIRAHRWQEGRKEFRNQEKSRCVHPVTYSLRVHAWFCSSPERNLHSYTRVSNDNSVTFTINRWAAHLMIVSSSSASEAKDTKTIVCRAKSAYVRENCNWCNAECCYVSLVSLRSIRSWLSQDLRRQAGRHASHYPCFTRLASTWARLMPFISSLDIFSQDSENIIRDVKLDYENGNPHMLTLRWRIGWFNQVNLFTAFFFCLCQSLGLILRSHAVVITHLQQHSCRISLPLSVIRFFFFPSSVFQTEIDMLMNRFMFPCFSEFTD